MNNIHKLTDNVRDYFEFDMYGTIYKMRYPNGEDRKIMAAAGQKLQKAIAASEENGDDTKVEAETEEMTKLINGLVSSDNPKAESIEAALEKAPSPVLRNFQEMILAELSIETPIKK